MSAAVILEQVVTPTSTRRRARVQQLRGPAARPQQGASRAGRPVQPAAPGAGAPVLLVRRPVQRAVAAPAGVRLTDRGLALVLGLVAFLVVATVGVGLVKFFGVSNAPLEQAPVHRVVSATPGVTELPPRA